MAYGARLRTALRAGTRYIAYTSDVGEAFRPVVPPWVVTAAYGVSWLYLSGDVGYESYKAHRRGPSTDEAASMSETTRIAIVAAQRATFQSIASMALPAFTIHTAVKQAKKAFVSVQNPKFKMWGPTVSGLAIVPVLPTSSIIPSNMSLTVPLTGYAKNSSKERWQTNLPNPRPSYDAPFQTHSLRSGYYTCIIP
ncbi:mitochondrial 18 KDa protein-domain-containing protein [Cyathus striatus]|nr:mitochondrial 18 KDa protein-domain-containing protein [Cyathus striatus]